MKFYFLEFKISTAQSRIELNIEHLSKKMIILKFFYSRIIFFPQALLKNSIIKKFWSFSLKLSCDLIIVYCWLFIFQNRSELCFMNFLCGDDEKKIA